MMQKAHNCTFISSTNEGNPPIDMKVTNPNTKDAHEPLALKEENTRNIDLIRTNFNMNKYYITWIKQNNIGQW